MAKTNFTKVEEALAEGMQKMTVNKLLTEADVATGKKGPQKEDNSINLLLASLRHDLKWLSKQNPEFYKELSIDKKKTVALLKTKDPLTQEQITVLKQLKEKIDQYKAKNKTKDSESENERLIQDEKKSQKNKRFNIRDKWLPLH